jgi:Putative MetA-pathway of phenol degradation
MKIEFMRLKIKLSLSFIFFIIAICQSQTELDAIMMNKNQFCNGLQYTHSSWKNYWEGELKRDNPNLGTVTTQSVMYMANYGITDNLNVMVGAPYIWTKPSAGTLTGMSGIQDISAFVKWRAYQQKIGKGKLSLFAIGGLSTPLSDYVIDFLPFSIGLGTTNLTIRGMADYLIGKINITGSASYIKRSNTTLDRSAYYDTELRLTNEVNMPDAALYQLRVGYRGKYLLAEGFLMNWSNMPFPSNKMNNTAVGTFVKYTIKQHTNLALVANANFTVAGRNMGQANTYSAGAFYAFYFGKNHKK